MVFANEAKKTRTFVAWNPTGKPQTVQFFEGTKLLGKLDALPHGITKASSLKQ